MGSEEEIIPKTNNVNITHVLPFEYSPYHLVGHIKPHSAIETAYGPGLPFTKTSEGFIFMVLYVYFHFLTL